MALPRYRSYLAIAKETAHAAGVAPTPQTTPSDWIPVLGLNSLDNIKYLEDKNWRGSMAETYGMVQGNIHAEFEFNGDVFPDTIGYPIAGLLADYAITGSASPYTHTMSTKNSGNGQGSSYTITDYNSNNARQFAGCQFESLDFKFSADGLLEYTAKAMGFQSSVVSEPSSRSYGAVTNVPVWTGVTTIAGNVNARLAEGNIAIKRTITPIFTVDGNQAPYQLFQGAVMVDGAMKLVFEDDTELGYYLNNTQPSLDIAFTQGTSTSQTVVQFHISKCAFKVAKIDRSKDFVELDVTYEAIANLTDQGATLGYSPIKVTLKNAKSTTVYA